MAVRLNACAVGVIVMAALACGAAGAEHVSHSGGGHVAILPVSELRAGMRGTGKTVFSGLDVEEFQIEVLGVLRRFEPGRDLILVRASGGPLERTGIIQGMSGSPIYIEGKLVGALAYAFPFAKEPIAGVTPIEDMFAFLDRDAAGEDLGALEGSAAPDRYRLADEGEGISGPGEDEALAAAGSAARGMPAEPRMSPVGVPLMISGFAEPVMSEMRAFFGEMGLVVSPGGVGDPAAPGHVLVPGSAVGVRLVDGDASVTAIGTLTHIDGDRVYAFGHPFFQAGDVALPLTGATIEALLPSQNVSTKFGVATRDVGIIDQDRSTGVSGRLGVMADLLPVRLRITPRGGEEVESHYRVVRHRGLTPAVVRWLVASAIWTREQVFGTSTVEVVTTVTLDDGRSLRRRDVGTDVPAGSASADHAGRMLEWVLQNAFERAKVREVDVTLSVDPSIRSASLERLVLESDEVEPGGFVRGRALLQPYRGERIWKEFALAVPRNVTVGQMTLEVCDASAAFQRDTGRAPGKYDPQSLDHLMALLEGIPVQDRLQVSLWTSGAGGVVLQGREIGPLPPSAVAVVGSARQRGGASATAAVELGRCEIETGYVISGCGTMTVRIKRPAEARRR